MPDPDQVHDHKRSDNENEFRVIYYHGGLIGSIGDKLSTFGGRFSTWIISGQTKAKYCADNPQFV